MIKMLATSRRKPGMTHAEYLHYVEHVHGAMAREKPLGIRRYVQSHIFDGGFGTDQDVGYQQPFHRDSVTELYFEDFAGLIQTFTDPHVQQKIGPDGANFADLSEQAAQLMAEVELPVANPGAAGIKVMHFLKKAEGVSLDDFFRRWSDAHHAWQEAHPQAAAHLRKYVQGRYLPEGDRITAYFGPNVRVYEGVASLWFDDDTALASFRAYRLALEASSAHGPAFFNPSGSFFVYGREVPIFDLT
ncbi:MAG: EthD domain-containing protein [Pseudomonadota bacterium]